MTTDFFEKYMHIVQLKYDLHASSEPEWNDWKKYSNGIIDEIAEITEEVKENNAIYLEDELGDILRDYMNLLHVLEQAGKIDSMQSVFVRSLKKYGQRIEAIDQGGKIDLHSSHRDRVKKIQKEENKEEHERRYGNQ